MKNRSSHKSSFSIAGKIVTIAAALLLTISLIVFYVGVPYVTSSLILKETRLVNGTPTWTKWTDVTIPILIKFYIFNVTNLEDAEQGGKFHLQEVGPYVWEEKRTKVITGIDEEDDTVAYKEVVWYYFRPDLSVGSQEDRVNVVNIALIAAATLIYKILYSTLANYLVDNFVSEGENFVLKDVNVRELIFDGVPLNELYGTLADFGAAELPDEFVNGTFAFYNRKNGTPTKEFIVNRGVKNYQDFGRIIAYDGKKEVPWWTNHSLPADAEQYCNKINGTDGGLVAPFVSKDHPLQFFAYELCHSVYAEFDREVTFQEIPAYRFSLPERLLADAVSNEDNRCFCKDPGDSLANNCDRGGTIRMGSCKSGAPIILSLPHFLNGDKRYLEEVDGLSPNKSLHDTSLIIEPYSGVVLQACKRIQIGVEFQRLPNIVAFDNITPAFIPLFWVEERSDLSEEDVLILRNDLVVPLEITRISKPLVLGFLTIALISGLVMIMLSSRKTPMKPLLENRNISQ